MADIFVGQDGKLREWTADEYTNGVVEERKRIVAWLRRDSTRESEPAAWDYADAIEREEHIK